MTDKPEQFVEELMTRIPEMSSESFQIDLPHDAFGTLALLLCRKIHEGASEDFLDRVFDLLNEMATSQETEVLDLLVTGVLEVISDYDECSLVAEQRLNPSGQALLREVKRWWTNPG